MCLGESVLRGPVLASRRVRAPQAVGRLQARLLVPRIKGDGTLKRKMASYADAMAASVHLLAMAGLPIMVRTYWSEHSERTVLPTGLSLKPTPPADRDMLGRWKPEGSDICMRAYGGRARTLPGRRTARKSWTRRRSRREGWATRTPRIPNLAHRPRQIFKRARWISEPGLLEIPEGQPLRLRLLRAILKSADNPDRDYLRRAEEGLPLGILEGLPRTPHVFEEQTSWRLDKNSWEPALAWVPNYASIEDHKDFVRAKFEEDVQEDLMEKMTLGEFKARFGENRAIASLAVIVEDEEKDKKRIIHDATHGVRVNHRIRCRDKIRAPGAREKKQILRELQANKEIAYSVVGDISKAHRRYKHQASEHGFMGCQIDGEETVDGDPDSQIVYVNKGELLVDQDSSMWDTGCPSPVGSRLSHGYAAVRRRP